MPKYVATILIDVDEEFKNRRSSKRAVKAFLESRILAGDVDELLFRTGKVVIRIREVEIAVMEID